MLALADIRDVRKGITQPSNNLGVLIVTASDLLKMGARALGQQQYGRSAVGVFDSIESALAYVDTR